VTKSGYEFICCHNQKTVSWTRHGSHC